MKNSITNKGVLKTSKKLLCMVLSATMVTSGSTLHAENHQGALPTYSAERIKNMANTTFQNTLEIKLSEMIKSMEAKLTVSDKGFTAVIVDAKGLSSDIQSGLNNANLNTAVIGNRIYINKAGYNKVIETMNTIQTYAAKIDAKFSQEIEIQLDSLKSIENQLNKDTVMVIESKAITSINEILLRMEGLSQFGLIQDYVANLKSTTKTKLDNLESDAKQITGQTIQNTKKATTDGMAKVDAKINDILFPTDSSGNKTISNAGLLFIFTLFVAGATFQVVIIPMLLITFAFVKAADSLKCKVMTCETPSAPGIGG